MASYRQIYSTPIPKLNIVSSQKEEDVDKAENRQNWLIPLISIGILVIFVLIALFIVWGELFGKPLSLPCPAGLCATNIYNGEKTCPSSDTGIVMYDPTSETCNVAGGCSNSGPTPCLYYDTTIGTVCPGDPLYSSLSGICPSGPSPNPVSSTTACKCMSRRYCPNFATVYYNQVAVQNPGYTGPNETFNTYVQETVWIDQTNAPRNDQPLSPAPANTSAPVSCAISTTNLPNVWPSNICVNGALTYNQPDGLWYCTNVPSTLNCTVGYVTALAADGSYSCIQASSITSS